MIIKKGFINQTISDVNAVGFDEAVLFSDDGTLPFEFASDASANANFTNYPVDTDYFKLSQSGVYTVDISMELNASASGASGMFPVELTIRNTDPLDVAWEQDVELASSTIWVSDQTYSGATRTFWVTTTMTFIADNVNEKLHMDLFPYGGSVDVVRYKFVVARIGAE